MARHFDWGQDRCCSSAAEEACWGAAGTDHHLAVGADTCVAPSATAWQEKVGVRLWCLARGAWPKGWLPPCLWGEGCQLPNVMSLPSPRLVPAFYETSETWRFSSDGPLLLGFGDDTCFIWKHNIKMMVFLLQLYFKVYRRMCLLHFSSQGVAWKMLLCSYRCWL